MLVNLIFLLTSGYFVGVSWVCRFSKTFVTIDYFGLWFFQIQISGIKKSVLIICYFWNKNVDSAQKCSDADLILFLADRRNLSRDFTAEFLHVLCLMIAKEVAVHRCSLKQVFLKILQYSQENICAGVSFWYSCRPETLLKGDSNAGVFLWILWNF